MSVADELENWLRKQAVDRIAAANSRRGYIRALADCSDEDKESAHVIAEKLAGRKIPKTTEQEDKKAAAIQERIADKLDGEASMILGFADFVARELKIGIAP